LTGGVRHKWPRIKFAKGSGTDSGLARKTRAA
jgi:hypothetical protein